MSERTFKLLPNKQNVFSGINTSIWYGYLIWLFVVSFANQPFASFVWVLASAVLFMLFAIYLTLSFFTSSSWRSIYEARIALILFALMIGLLLLQLFLPMGSPFDAHVFSNDDKPSWFIHGVGLTVVQNRTAWLLMSSLMVCTLFVLTLCLIDCRQRARQLVMLIMVVGLTHALIAIVAKYNELYLVDRLSLDGHYEVARGVFINRNHFAAFISLCLFSAISVQLKQRISTPISPLSSTLFKQWITFSFLCFLIGMVAVFLSESRGVFLTLVFSIGLIIISFGNNQKLKVKRSYFVMVFIAVLIILSLFFGQGLFERLSQNSVQLGERIIQWLITIQAIKHAFLLGYGAGSYELIFQTYREYNDLRIVVYDQAHNDYLHILLEQGVLGLVLWLSFIVFVLQFAFRQYLKAKSSLISSILLSGMIVVLAILIQSLVGYPLQIITIRCYFFVIVGLLLSVPFVHHRTK